MTELEVWTSIAFIIIGAFVGAFIFEAMLDDGDSDDE